MGASSSPASGGGLLTEINVTPLVDVVLVLLVLMMVTATAIAQKTIPVELPKAKSGEGASAEKPLTVVVDEAGRLFLDDGKAEVSADAVRERARAAHAKDAAASAVLAADGRARHEAVVKALELLRGEHVAKIAIVVKAEGR